MLAICTPACGRADLTRRTLASFMQHNPVAANLARYMAVDFTGTADDEANVAIASEFGWNVCAMRASGKRGGLMWSLESMTRHAAWAGAKQMLWLENDWECVKPLGDIPSITKSVDCVRLYGAEKQADGSRPAGTFNMVTGLMIPWQPCGEIGGQQWQSAKAHFGGAPSIVDLQCLLPFTDRPTMKDMAKAMGEIRTVRPSTNYFWHIGLDQTPQFKH